MSSPGQSAAAAAQLKRRKGDIEERSGKAAESSSAIAEDGAKRRSTGGRLSGLSGCCCLVLWSLALGVFALWLLSADSSSSAPEGLASSPAHMEAQQQLDGGAGAAAAAAAAAGGALGLLKPQASWSALVLGGSGATGRVLVAKLANK